MADNFNIAKFLKENSLGSYGILGHYVDLQPLKEMDKESEYDDGKDNQYDGKYDDESGPATANEEVSVSSSGVEMEEGIEDDPQFEDDMSKMINHIVRGYGYIDPEYVQQTWEMASDIPFEEVQDKVFAELVRAGLTNYDDIDEVKETKEGDYEYKSAEEFDTEPQEGPNDPLGPNVSKTPRADFQDAIYAANGSGLYKEQLIILVNQNSK
jgi:hypothetical protein